ncbi:hypothetical protein TRFO_31843 [Tritrichomonas foetus]|uniref:Uncharacterized protein n=1 Tax=Tritrichomonas foetus TaxID=1144522 RepID=A0A1J4JV57_9EUKA|nr:hypothetical protein TRFO_31843 [Tritrichomonas foetus]|eukprot:OHT01404.1 hypothetical protein TRFO_31843 [Tritrichomonas foetus]
MENQVVVKDKEEVVQEEGEEKPKQPVFVLAVNALDAEEKKDDENAQKKEEQIQYLPDFIPPEQQGPSKSKTTKYRTIYCKNMQSKLPTLKWLPGELLQIRLNSDDDATFDKFEQSVRQFKIVSIMIFCETNEEEKIYNISALTFSTPLVTVYFDFRQILVRTKNKITIPHKLLQIVSSPDVTIICPGRRDWHYSLSHNHLEILKDLNSDTFGFENNIVYLEDFREKLYICKSGKEVCEHMKMIYWLFQLKFDVQFHGNQIPLSLTPQWKNLVSIYGKMLIFTYYALQEKLEQYTINPKNGVNIKPIYLENLLIEHKLVENMDLNTLRKKLIGFMQYPNPPLPNLPVSTK